MFFQHVPYPALYWSTAEPHETRNGTPQTIPDRVDRIASFSFPSHVRSSLHKLRFSCCIFFMPCDLHDVYLSHNKSVTTNNNLKIANKLGNRVAIKPFELLRSDLYSNFDLPTHSVTSFDECISSDIISGPWLKFLNLKWTLKPFQQRAFKNKVFVGPTMPSQMLLVLQLNSMQRICYMLH